MAALFNIAFKRTMGDEGSYSNDPEDKGGETVWGISRYYHEHWEGWARVDALKAFADDDIKTISAIIAEDKPLLAMVKKFYKSKFWDRVKGDSIQSQVIANELFDTAVNCGKTTASKFLQVALNKLNRDGDSYSDITVDGGVGAKTISALGACLELDNEEILLYMLNCLQCVYYIETSKERYIRGLVNKRARD